MSAPKIFISYRREDSAGSAGRLYDHLANEFGEDVLFKDVDNIPVGQNFPEFIGSTIKSCGILIVVIGRHFLSADNDSARPRIFEPDDFVQAEINLGLTFKKTVIPVLVDNAEMPSSKELPVEIAEIASINGFSIRHERWKSDISALSQKIRKILEAQEIEIQPATEIKKQAAQAINPHLSVLQEKDDLLNLTAEPGTVGITKILSTKAGKRKLLYICEAIIVIVILLLAFTNLSTIFTMMLNTLYLLAMVIGIPLSIWLALKFHRAAIKRIDERG